MNNVSNVSKADREKDLNQAPEAVENVADSNKIDVDSDKIPLLFHTNSIRFRR